MSKTITLADIETLANLRDNLANAELALECVRLGNIEDVTGATIWMLGKRIKLNAVVSEEDVRAALETMLKERRDLIANMLDGYGVRVVTP